MKRILIIASHEKMADGMKDTLNFISGGITGNDRIVSLCGQSSGRRSG